LTVAVKAFAGVARTSTNLNLHADGLKDWVAESVTAAEIDTARSLSGEVQEEAVTPPVQPAWPKVTWKRT